MRLLASLLSVVLFPVLAYAQTYCTPSLSSSFGAQITKVSFAGISKSTAASPCASYNYYTSPVGSCQPGQTLPISVDVVTGCESSGYTVFLRVYIDYNDNGSFTDPGETAFAPASFAVGTATKSGNITIPAGAARNILRMRVVLDEDGNNSCGGTGYYGEAEDYDLDLTCPAKSGISISRSGDECTSANETFTATGVGAGITLTWETSTDGVIWTTAGTGTSIALGPYSQATQIRAKADNGTCFDYITTQFSKLAWTATATPDLICPGSTSQLDAPNFPSNYDFINTTSYTVPDNNPSGGTSPLSVVGVLPTSVGNGTINKVCFSLTHAYNSDVIIYLIGPDGTQLTLANKKGGANYTNTCFAPGAATALPAGNNKTGTYRPDGGDLYTAFNGKPTNGTWKLFAVDNVNVGAGTITKFQITFNGGTIAWTPTAGLSNSSIKNPIATVSSNTTYTATYTPAGGGSCTPSASVAVNVKPTYSPTVTGTTTICEGNSTTLTATATQTGCSFNWYTAASGGTLLNSSATYSVSPASTATYYVEATYNGCTGTRTPVTVTVVPTPATPTGSNVQVCYGQSPSLSASSSTSGTVIDWYDAATGGTLLGSGSPFSPAAITNNTTYYAEATKSGCPSTRQSITATVNPLPATPTAADASICSGSTANLSATAPGGTYRWYAAATGGTVLATAAGYTTPVLTNATQTPTTQSYYVSVTDANGCVSDQRKQVTVTIKSIPPAPTVTSPVKICSGTTVALTATATIGDRIDWWNLATGGSIFKANNANYTTSALTLDTTFYISSRRTGCYSATRTPLTVQVVNRPVLNAIADKAVCSGLSVNQVISGTPAVSTVDLSWSASLISGTASGFTTTTSTSSTIADILTNTSSGPAVVEYTITAFTKGTPACQGNTVTFRVTVNPLPATVTAPDVAICHNTTATLTATAPGNDYFWYSASSGGTALNATPSATYTTGNLTTTGGSTIYNYYVDNIDANGCVSKPRTLVKVTVYPIPSAPIVANATVCTDSSATLTVTSPGDQFNWYNVSSGGSAIYSGSSFNTPNIPSNTTFYVSTTTNNCTGPRKAINVNTIATPTITAINDVTYCSNTNINQLLTGAHTNGVKYQWTSAVSVGSATGNTNPISSTSTNRINDIIANTGTTVANVDYSVVAISNTAPACPSVPQTFTISVNPEYDVTSTITDVICYGLSTGEIIADGSAAKQPASYTWKKSGSTIGTNATIGNLSFGSYDLIVTDADGCSVYKTYNVSQPVQDIAITGSITNVNCFSNATGGIVTTTSNAVDPITYTWSTGETTKDLNNIPAGGYTLSITDDNGCTKSKTFAVAEPAAALSATSLITHVLCYGNSTGKISLTTTGGTAPYTYGWSTGATNGVVQNLAAGSYSVTVTDNKGCLFPATYSVNQPITPLTLGSTITDVNCFGQSTGAIDITASGGTAPYSYKWDNNSTDEDRSALPSGNYSVVATDKNNCTVSSPFTVNQLPAISASLAAKQYIGGTNISCSGLNDGEIDLTPSGGTAPYTYLWSNGSSDEDQIGLTAGTYLATVTDINGCSNSFSTTLNQPEVLSQSISDKTYAGGWNITCNGFADGEITPIASGGTAPYSYFSNGILLSSGKATGLSAGAYLISTSDANGCQVDAIDTLYEPGVLTASSTLSQHNSGDHVACFGDKTGNINLTTVGGTSPYTFDWSESSTTEDISDLGAGTYSVTIQDANNCLFNNSFTLTEPGALSLGLQPSVYPSGDNISCFGFKDGSVKSTVTGGASPYNYSWSNGALSPDISLVTAGTYNLLITDLNGCKISQSVTLTSPTQLTHGFTLSNFNGYGVSCFNGSNGTIQSKPQNGAGSYTWLWNTGDINPTISGKPAGNYTVTITDLNGCKLTDNVALTQPPKLNVNGSTSNFNGYNIPCYGQSLGSINLTVSGGVSSYGYSWSGGLPSQKDQNSLPAGNYSVTVTDANSCVASYTVTLTEPAKINVVASQTAFIKCNGDLTGAYTAFPSGGITPYSYSWTNIGGTVVSNGATASNLAAGSYNLKLTDNNGCTYTLTGNIINQPSPISASITPTHLTCYNDASGAVSAVAGGGTPSYTYQWLGGPSSPNWNGLQVGTYALVITDNNLCKDTFNALITEPGDLVIATLSQQLVSCDGLPQGEIKTAANGGTLPYSFNWSNGSMGADLSGLFPGNYTLSVIDDHGCQTSQLYNVQNIVTPDPGFTYTDPLCGETELPIIANVYDPGASFNIISGNATINSTNGINYLVNAPFGTLVLERKTNNSGCSDSSRVSIVFREIPPASFNSRALGSELSVLENKLELINTSVQLSGIPTTFSWTLDSVVVGDQPQLILDLPNNEGKVHGICLVAATSQLCTYTYCEPILVVGKSLVFVPNSFTPDGDGINDVFSISHQDVELSDFFYGVYNRSGGLVFSSTNPDFVWSGDYDGIPLPSGVYIYEVRYTSPVTNEKYRDTGALNLFR